MRIFNRALLVALFAVAAIAPAYAQVGEPAPYNVTSAGIQQTLASAVVATTNQVFSSNFLGRPKVVTLCLSASGATTFTVTASTSNVLFYASSLPNSATAADYAPSGAGTLCENVTPAAYYKVKTSAAVTVSVEIQAAY